MKPNKLYYVSNEEIKTTNKNMINICCKSSFKKYFNKYKDVNYIYEATINKKKILYIKTIVSLSKFIKSYSINNLINWEILVKEYSGIIICPYLGDKIWGKYATDFHIHGDTTIYYKKLMELLSDNPNKDELFFTAEWYRHWGATMGFIWNDADVKLKCIKKLDNLFI